MSKGSAHPLSDPDSGYHIGLLIRYIRQIRTSYHHARNLHIPRDSDTWHIRAQINQKGYGEYRRCIRYGSDDEIQQGSFQSLPGIIPCISTLYFILSADNMKISYRCLKCGHVFIYVKGDFVHEEQRPSCPECGSKLVI